MAPSSSIPPTEKRLPPGPKTLMPGGHLLPILRNPIGFLTRLSREYGDRVHFKVRGTDAFFFNDPELLKEVLITQNASFEKGPLLKNARMLLGDGLLTSEGEVHLRQRRLCQPAFQPRNLGVYADPMVECAAAFREEWAEGAEVDVSQEMMRLTLTTVGRTLFNAEVKSEAEEIGEMLTHSIRMLNLLGYPFASLLLRLPLPARKTFERNKARLDSLIYRMIQDRRERPHDRRDLLAVLLRASEADEYGGMSDQQLRDEAITIFLAGHETMATSLTWTWYLLSQNPEAEANLHAEIDAVLGDRLPGYEDLERLTYTNRVFAESLRVYPPAWALARQAMCDVEIGGYAVPAGSLVIMSQWVMHHDPRFFPDPDRFDPDRWTPELKEQLPRFAYFPFGGGPRNCIGEGFAWMEGTLLLATLAQRWRPLLVPGHRVAVQPLITLRAKHGMRMILERR
ncbi:MAG: cytochrome P450 [Armatimonadetes bacterium]|nr:cytochrome P450 [Armatimonadota bacterium]